MAQPMPLVDPVTTAALRSVMSASVPALGSRPPPALARPIRNRYAPDACAGYGGRASARAHYAARPSDARPTTPWGMRVSCMDFATSINAFVSGFPQFILQLGVALALFVASLFIYVIMTPHKELDLIRARNASAA